MSTKKEYQAPKSAFSLLLVEGIVCASDPPTGGSETPDSPIVIPTGSI